MNRLALVVRWVGPLSVLLTALFFDAVGASVMMLVCLAVTVMWRARPPAALEVVTDLTLLLAAWSSVLLLYERYPYWDLVIHFSATAVLAELALRALERWARFSPPGPVSHVVVVGSLGAGLALLWEYLEFAGYWFVDPRVNVGYLDTMGDLVAGHAGAVLAGVLGTWARRRAARSGGGRTAEDGTGGRGPAGEPGSAERPGTGVEPGTTVEPDTAVEPNTTEKKD